MRVMSRRPWPAIRTCSWSDSTSWPARTLESTCGVCETRATAASCSARPISTGSAPQAVDEAVHATDVVDSAGVERGDDPEPVVEQVGACPSRARDLATGHRVPADQTSRVGPSGDGLDDHALLDGRHVGERRVGPALGRVGEDGRRPPGRHGDDDDDRHVVVAQLPAGTRIAGDRDMVAGSTSESSTSTPARRRDSATDVPIRPVPMTATEPSMPPG